MSNSAEIEHFVPNNCTPHPGHKFYWLIDNHLRILSKHFPRKILNTKHNSHLPCNLDSTFPFQSDTLESILCRRYYLGIRNSFADRVGSCLLKLRSWGVRIRLSIMLRNCGCMWRSRPSIWGMWGCLSLECTPRCILCIWNRFALKLVGIRCRTPCMNMARIGSI
jgi:hypothetical protein